MIDSISVRLHDSSDSDGNSNHNALFRMLTFVSEGVASIHGQKIDLRTYAHELSAGHLNLSTYDILVNELHYDPGKESEKRIPLVKGRIPSSNHYDAGYRINYGRDFVDFSFSIPKFIYGHNVAQFVSHPTVYNVTGFKGLKSTFFDNAEKLYSRLKRIIELFFNDLFPHLKINYTKVELIRIDFCFNQYFSYRDESLRYLEFMYKKVHATGSSMAESEIMLTPSKSKGFISVGKNHYYKVYHKGNEFETVGDQKRLMRENVKTLNQIQEYKRLRQQFEDMPKSNLESTLYDIDTLKNQADKILRHEARFVPGSMSYFYKRYVYRKNDPVWIEQLKTYHDLKAKQMRFQRHGKMKDFLDKDEKAVLKEREEKLDKRHRFFLWPTAQMKKAVDPNVSETEQQHNKEQWLSPELFYFLLKEKFWGYVENCQVSQVPEYEKIKKYIIDYNTKVDAEMFFALQKWSAPEDLETVRKLFKKKMLRFTKVVKILEDLKRYGSLHDMLELGAISRATFYRYQKVLEIVKTATAVYDGNPIKVDLTFSSYFESIQTSRTVYNAILGHAKPAHLTEF